MAERFVEAQGLRVRYLEEGEGKEVLLLHGASLGSSCDVWAEMMPMLAARGLRVIALDQPGFGGSDISPDDSVGFRTTFVPAFLDALGVARACVVGHSQAGRIAVNLALKESQRVDRIVIVGTASLLPPLRGTQKGDAEGDEEGGAEPTEDEVRRLLEGQLFDAARATPERIALRHRMSTGRNFEAFLARRAAKARSKGEKGGAPWERLAQVLLPMRLVYGRQDRAAEARAALARERLPALDLHLVDRCRHLVMWDAPETLASLIGEFAA